MKDVFKILLSLNSGKEELDNKISVFVDKYINKVIGEVLSQDRGKVIVDEDYVFRIPIPSTGCIYNGQPISVYELKFNFITRELFVISEEVETEFVNIEPISQLGILGVIFGYLATDI